MWTSKIIQLLSVLCVVLGICGEAVSGENLRSRARTAFQSGQFELAIELGVEVIKKSTETSEDHLFLGKAFLKNGDIGKAQKAFRKAANLGAKAAGYYGIGLTYARMKGQAERAMYYFRRALGRDSKFTDAQFQLALIYRKMRPGDAIGAFQRTLEMDPKHPEAYYQIGRLFEDHKQPKKAENAYRKQLEFAPTHNQAKFRLGKLMTASGQFRAAVEIFKELANSGSEVEPYAYMELAVLSQAAEQYESAQRLFESCIARLPEKEQRVFRDISLIANRNELKTYNNSPDHHKQEMEIRFWNRLDPTPLTRTNERLVEHYRRVTYARQTFSNGKFPWDDRGDIYVRLGSPDHVSRSEAINAARDPLIRDARVRFARRLFSNQPITFGYPAFPVGEFARWEYWVYAGLSGGSEITFVTEFGQGRYTFASFPGERNLSQTVHFLANLSNTEYVGPNSPLRMS